MRHYFVLLPLAHNGLKYVTFIITFTPLDAPILSPHNFYSPIALLNRFPFTIPIPLNMIKLSILALNKVEIIKFQPYIVGCGGSLIAFSLQVKVSTFGCHYINFFTPSWIGLRFMSNFLFIL